MAFQQKKGFGGNDQTFQRSSCRCIVYGTVDAWKYTGVGGPVGFFIHVSAFHLDRGGAAVDFPFGGIRTDILQIGSSLDGDMQIIGDQGVVPSESGGCSGRFAVTEWQFIVVIIIHCQSLAPLVETSQTGYRISLFSCFSQSRQKHCGENGDDRNHDEELDQGENFCFHPESKNRRTGNRKGRSKKTFEQLNIGTIQQWKEEGRSQAGQGLIPSSLRDHSPP